MALLIATAPPVIADDGADVYEDEVANEAKSLSAEDLTDEQLENYVAAESEIASIRLQHANDIASRGVDTATEAQAEMAATIEDHGLTVSEYREIAHLVANNAETSKRAKRIETRTH
ncbi:MAG: DUF4168 domain-containing protein [Halofilum sp. (in: g-proteobacteria)]